MLSDLDFIPEDIINVLLLYYGYDYRKNYSRPTTTLKSLEKWGTNDAIVLDMTLRNNEEDLKHLEETMQKLKDMFTATREVLDNLSVLYDQLDSCITKINKNDIELDFPKPVELVKDIEVLKTTLSQKSRTFFEKVEGAYRSVDTRENYDRKPIDLIPVAELEMFLKRLPQLKITMFSHLPRPTHNGWVGGGKGNTKRKKKLKEENLTEKIKKLTRRNKYHIFNIFF